MGVIINPWKTDKDVEKHKKGLSKKQNRQWRKVANSALKKCLEDGEEQDKCEVSAIKQANNVVGNECNYYCNNIGDVYAYSDKSFTLVVNPLMESIINNIQNIDKRVEQFEGKNNLIVPVTLIKPGVHNGILYTEEELGKFVETWNGIPVPIFHPEGNDGDAIPANSPDVIEKQCVGRIFNAFYDEGVKAEIWFDIEKLKKIYPEILELINSSKMIEVSTGLFLDEIYEEGVWNGEDYWIRGLNFRPDHLAVLPGSLGACSISDGCGIRNNKEEDEKEMDKDELIATLSNEETKKDKRKFFSLLSELTKKIFGIKTNKISHEDIRMTIQKDLEKKDVYPTDTDNYSRYHYLREVFDEYYIFEVYNNDGTLKLYKQEYTKNENNIEINGDAKEVEIEYSEIVSKNENSTINNSKGIDKTKENKTEDINVNNNGGKNDMCCEEKVNSLINNEATKFTKDDFDWLMTMEEDQLDKMLPIEKKEDEKKIEDNKEEEKKEEIKEEKKVEEKIEDNKEKITLDSLIENSGEYKEMLKEGLDMYKQNRDGMIKKILENKANAFTEAELKEMPMEKIKKIASLAVKEEDRDFTGNVPKIKDNDNKKETVPEPPKMKWNKDMKPDYSHIN